MKSKTRILILALFIVNSSCDFSGKEKETTKVENKETPGPRIMYVTYGYYCGECIDQCTKMYRHYLTGNATSFWTDTTDSYFKDDQLNLETEMTRASETIGFEVVNNIPRSILESESSRNIFGCPDCDDGCALYFDFQLDEPNSKPIIYEMQYDLGGTTAEVRALGELIIRTIEKLENNS